MYILIIGVYHLNLTQRRDYFETQKENLSRSPLFLDDWNSQIESKSLNQDQIIKYANYCGVYPKKVARILNLSEVQTQLRKGNAIYMGTAGYGNYSNSRHALALFGWVNQGGYQTYYVWNPWYNYPTVISANAGPVTIPVPGGGFTWDNTITNW